MLDRGRVMRRRQNYEIKVNHERWLVSYADFVTLLFAFFVVMYSVSQVSESKYKILSETLEKVFESDKYISDPQDLGSNFNGVDTPELKENLANLGEVKSDLESTLGEFVKNGDVAITGDVSSPGNEQWIEISLDASLLFSSGEANLQNSAITTFSDVAKILKAYDNSIEVSGHTDNLPISTNLFSNNWALSSARAVSVVNLLNSQGIKPERLSAVGYGEYRPIADNATATGRQENRRVVLRVADHALPISDYLADKTSFSKDVNQLDSSKQPNALAGSLNSENVDSETNQGRENTVDIQADTATPIKPVELKGGGLLFTSDPDLPRPGLK